jgi:hypothetical protein
MNDSGEKITFGETGLEQQPDGSYIDHSTGERITEDGKVFAEDGEVIYDPDDEEEFE